METQNIKLSLLENNEGQIPGVPRNPRSNSAVDFEKIKRSIRENPELLEYRSLLVYPFNGKYVAIGGNMRLRALRELGHKTAPCGVLPETCPAEKLKVYALIDNSSFGKWDWDDIANNWDDLPLHEYNIAAWSMPSAPAPSSPIASGAFQPSITPAVVATDPEVYAPAAPVAPTVYSPNLNPVDGEKPVTDSQIESTAIKMATAFQNQVQDMQEVICPCCGHTFYIKN